ncbi:MAG: aminotransferase class V-fold PLP-dependent enzyme [Halobacteriales archaeon]|nr:aminotransferase class V-fold PLP-dependent enzyme [Halobacteriales archaeon]
MASTITPARWVEIKKDFPTLARTFNGKPLVYLDSAATAQKPQAVTDAVVAYYTKHTANVHRAVYELSAEATERFEGAREKLRKFINAKSTKEVIWTKGATEAINLVRYSVGLNLKPGDKVLSTLMEHHSNFVPWQQLARRGVEVDYVKVTPDGLLDLADYEAKLTPNTKLVAVTQQSNVLGTINDIRAISDKAHAVGAQVMVDGAQSTPHMQVDVQAMDCDWFAVSGHKMLGPTGIGILYGKERILEQMEPFHYGGDMIKEVKILNTRWNDLPNKFEAGTQPIAEAIGLGAAVDYLNGIGMGNVRKHEQDLTAYAMDKLGKDASLTIYGPRDLSIRGGVVSFTMKKVHRWSTTCTRRTSWTTTRTRATSARWRSPTSRRGRTTRCAATASSSSCSSTGSSG